MRVEQIAQPPQRRIDIHIRAGERILYQLQAKQRVIGSIDVQTVKDWFVDWVRHCWRRSVR
ncbi:hypothetical protein NKJ40_25490 [Mesorhizobium sp. M0119]|uniref:hypothetical protein n=1 Tax=unclassified Mesorhizobium TaxID=325217 RepID=UPI00333B5916